MIIKIVLGIVISFLLIFVLKLKFFFVLNFISALGECLDKKKSKWANDKSYLYIKNRRLKKESERKQLSNSRIPK